MGGLSSGLILVFEALQEKKLSRIADAIAQREGVKVVLIAVVMADGDGGPHHRVVLHRQHCHRALCL